MTPGGRLKYQDDPIDNTNERVYARPMITQNDIYSIEDNGNGFTVVSLNNGDNVYSDGLVYSLGDNLPSDDYSGREQHLFLDTPNEYDEYYEGDGMTDAEADADVLRMAGWGTDEDYGYYGDDFDY